MSDHQNHLARALSLVDQRAVEKAIELYESEGALRCEVEDEMVLATVEHCLLLRNGKCVAASLAAIEGASLIGWLLSSPRTSGVGAWWRRGARAVFLVRREGRPDAVVLDESTSLRVGGVEVEPGFATQKHRFVVARSDRPPLPPAPPSRPQLRAGALPDLFDAIDEDVETLPGHRRPDVAC
jgi:hypothetical protein